MIKQPGQPGGRGRPTEGESVNVSGTTDPAALPVPGHRPAQGAAEVWVLPASPDRADAAERFRWVLDPAERERADAFSRPRDRTTYTVAHAGLRLLLGRYLGLPPEDVVTSRADCPLCGEPHGRPVVDARPELCFSLSHTRGLAVCAFAVSPVGVDVESSAAEAAAELTVLLHPAERAAVDALPEVRRSAAFLHCWVRKEAYLKGLGVGLGVPLDSVDVGLGEEFGAPGPDPAGLEGWGLAPVPVPGGNASAVALLLPSGAGPVRAERHTLDLAARPSPDRPGTGRG